MSLLVLASVDVVLLESDEMVSASPWTAGLDGDASAHISSPSRVHRRQATVRGS